MEERLFQDVTNPQAELPRIRSLKAFQVTISPPQRTRKGDDVGEAAFLTLAPFNSQPTVSFGEVKVGTQVTRKLIIFSPKNASEVVIEKVPDEFQMEQRFNIDASGKMELEVSWTPMKEVQFRESVHVNVVNGSRYRFFLHGIAVEPRTAKGRKKALRRKKMGSLPCMSETIKTKPPTRSVPCDVQIEPARSDQMDEVNEVFVSPKGEIPPCDVEETPSRRSTFLVASDRNKENDSPYPRTFNLDQFDFTPVVGHVAQALPTEVEAGATCSISQKSPIEADLPPCDVEGTPVHRQTFVIPRMTPTEEHPTFDQRLRREFNFTPVDSRLTSTALRVAVPYPCFGSTSTIASETPYKPRSRASTIFERPYDDCIASEAARDAQVKTADSTMGPPRLLLTRDLPPATQEPRNTSSQRKRKSFLTISPPSKGRKMACMTSVASSAPQRRISYQRPPRQQRLSLSHHVKPLHSVQPLPPVKLYDPETMLTSSRVDPFASSTTVDPFAISTMFYDEKWVSRQETDFLKWLNALLTPPEELSCDNSGSLADNVVEIWQRCMKGKNVIPAPSKEAVMLSAYKVKGRLDVLRQAAIRTFQSEEVAKVLEKVVHLIDNKSYVIRSDRDLHKDLGLKQGVLSTLLSYNSIWLRIGLEVVYGEIIPLQSNSDLLGLSKFIINRLLYDPTLGKKHAHPTVPHLYGPGFEVEQKQFTFRKVLMLVFFLDHAKTSHLIRHDPCLFRKTSAIKSSRDLLLTFTRDLVKGGGDLSRQLSFTGYKLVHEQKFLDEFEYAVTNLGMDLRCGVRLVHIAEILINDWTLSTNLRVPPVSRGQKIHNVGVALNAFRSHGMEISKDLDARDIVDGHREKTLSLLWQLLHRYQGPRMEAAATKLQRWWLGMRWRLAFLKTKAAVGKITRWWRQMQETKEERLELRELLAAKRREEAIRRKEEEERVKREKKEKMRQEEEERKKREEEERKHREEEMKKREEERKKREAERKIREEEERVKKERERRARELEELKRRLHEELKRKLYERELKKLHEEQLRKEEEERKLREEEEKRKMEEERRARELREQKMRLHEELERKFYERELKKLEEERLRKEEEERQLREEEEQRKREAEKRRLREEEEQRKREAEECRLRKEEEQRKREEEKRRLHEEEQRKREEEERRLREEEDQRKRDEEEQRKREEEERRLHEEEEQRKRDEEEQRKREEEERRLHEEEEQRKREAEERRLREEEDQRKRDQEERRLREEEEQKLCHAATVIQSFFRGYRVRQAKMEEERRKEEAKDRRLCHAATVIQSFYRGYRVRKCNPEASEVRASLQRVSREINDSHRLGNRMAWALRVIMNRSEVTNLGAALKAMATCTGLLSGCCRSLVDNSVIPLLFDTMRGLLRSPADIMSLEYALEILINLSKYEETQEDVWLEFWRQPNVALAIHHMLSYHMKEVGVFCRYCFLIWLFWITGDDHRKRSIKEHKELMARIDALEDKCQKRKAVADSVEKKAQAAKKGLHTSAAVLKAERERADARRNKLPGQAREGPRALVAPAWDLGGRQKKPYKNAAQGISALQQAIMA